ncbi:MULTISPECIES: thiolase family protein [Microbacterium]|uniref:Acetyl-CoA acyltransferase n=1 Tax=Microbacterium saccharophilum TaxID=1213358 RepID=A0A7Z7CZU6_9MICO|nr:MULTISPECIES: thiolase family protein [Microbacterium]SFI78059.1 acetyl-CoA acyltransferase [Microbacterium saccharophilum]
MRSAVIVDVIRSPSGRGKPGGALSGLHPVDLLATVLASLAERSSLDPALVEDVIVGCVDQVGEQALNVGRQAVLAAGWPEEVPATTIDRQCGSSQQAAAFAAQGVIAGAYDIVIAAGVESMSRVPMGSAVAGSDFLGPSLRARYPEGLVNQGVAAELIAKRWSLSRDDLDEYAAESHRRASAAARGGLFDSEILAVPLPDGTLHVSDETIRAATTVDGLRTLPASFDTAAMRARFPDLEWNVTAGNASPLTDGASGALIMEEGTAIKLGLTPRARFHSFAVCGDDPLFMLTGPIPATARILKKSGMTLDDIAVYEVNEAFASVPLAWAHEWNADPARLNPRGGAIALGHPLGASGTRILATLVNELEASAGQFGLQVMCEGGGMANATLIERM